MRNLVLLAALLACAVALPEPQGLFRGRKIGGNRGNNNRPSNRNAFSDDKPTQTRGSLQAATPATTPKPKKEVSYACNENACAPGYSKFENKCYKVIQTDTPIDFSSAQRKCQADNAVLAADKSSKIHNFLKDLLKPHLSQTIDSQNNRAFLGLLCQDACESPANWVYADGSRCEGNDFCDWLKTGSSNEWNSLPNSLYGPSIAAMLDDYPDTNFRHKLQPYPSDHSLQYMICQKDADSTEHLKPRDLKVQERLANVVIEWERPSCSGEFSNYILVLLGGSASYDTEMKCSENKCSYTLNPEVCNYCILPNTDYTFSVAAVLSESQLGPAITINKKIDVETCPNFETPIHTISTCRGVSEVVHDGSCDNQITWSKAYSYGRIMKPFYVTVGRQKD
ncbi:uncharacterized protein LOC134763117 [Penaeus indicus]|uniref:uncharacterized protein LOC134763117 n=1 Tax=Penaeus indicus TaxID=29960 RepID=UPI00300D998B